MDKKNKKTVARFLVGAASPLKGIITVPGDKSISHRALLLGAIAKGTTVVQHCLLGADNLSTLHALQQLGVPIEVDYQSECVTIEGQGLYGLKYSQSPLDLGNAGTGMRLMMGLLSAQLFDSELIGDESLTRRPMRRVADPLRQMGAKIRLTDAGTAPIKVEGGAHLQGMTYDLPVPSAQVKSALLLAGLYADGQTTVKESVPLRDHTERLLSAMGYEVTQSAGQVSIQGKGSLQAITLEVPGDFSSAAFFIVAATLIPDSKLVIRHVGINPTRIGLVHMLRAMGAKISFENAREVNREPVADIVVESTVLHGIEVPLEWVPLAIDEFPIFFIAAACAKGQTIVRGATELRVKETDRIKAMADGLLQLGCQVEVLSDGLIVTGMQNKFNGGRIDSYGDHRIAMAFSVAACVAEQPIEICDVENIGTSFPGFVALANAIGFKIQEEGNVMIGQELAYPEVKLAPVITIDGPSASGKGTISRLLAAKLGWLFLDSGALYRAFGWAVLQAQLPLSEEERIQDLLKKTQIELLPETRGHRMQVICNGVEITDAMRTEACGLMASQLSAFPWVRQELLKHQWQCRQFPGLVADGRDMGTIVFPDAPIKIFLEADVTERARRRFVELQNKAVKTTLEAVQQDLERRDNLDRNRVVAPLKPAGDAIIVDTTHLSIDEVVEKVMVYAGDVVL